MSDWGDVGPLAYIIFFTLLVLFLLAAWSLMRHIDKLHVEQRQDKKSRKKFIIGILLAPVVIILFSIEPLNKVLFGDDIPPSDYKTALLLKLGVLISACACLLLKALGKPYRILSIITLASGILMIIFY